MITVALLTNICGSVD